jgi:hypothetical protein
MRLKLGYSFTIYTGNCSGHYLIDLGKADDQTAGFYKIYQIIIK